MQRVENKREREGSARSRALNYNSISYRYISYYQRISNRLKHSQINRHSFFAAFVLYSFSFLIHLNFVLFISPGRVSEKKMLKIRYASNQWPQSPQDKMREATTQNEQSSREESEITRYSSEIIFCFFLLSSSSYVSHFVAVCKTAN